ncbi:phytanoyl-CoA dioxygenase family protein [Nocardia sp. CDC159]|uniref:Phytanoyl-CoA dioxygenase family protein n=1 Tax=Nocardia pulmonis TaxID=2951408 RepID=A0A9X2IW72_9NOCA|nr:MULTISPECIES: phytanoyl-CoA dioxygenase family protein [Nocardia]MCM6773978.1 phytanoyl-CoA dioxygenase family protein [Nocardia pulmonis]MCM6786865.1 phytanoyl-CoA dioxygenase family protein [Nocardia sp. CDC159]
MLIDAKQQYDSQGFCVMPQRLSDAMLAQVRESISEISGMTRPEVVYEKDGKTVRALHGCHRFDDVCADLVRLPLFVELAESILGEEVYVYQFKVNIKNAVDGERWPWHQDYAFWSIEDGMPADRAMNIAINLDDVYDWNGPLQVLAGTHLLGLIPSPDHGATSGGDWRDHVSADLTYTVGDQEVEELGKRHELHRLTGPAGTISAFHPNIVHSSARNTSSDRRTILYITYNAVSNSPRHAHRPHFLVDPITTAVRKLDQPLALTPA